ncbi:threonine/serine dehydratase [Candidatus Aminicenantes bacterium AC-334-K16]|jgi:threonine dehydratase|nr:threonine/serine dehydratase [Candidatus Aminicenantes bacterium AC-334-K16]
MENQPPKDQLVHHISSLVTKANQRIQRYLRQTPVDYSYYLSHLTQNQVYLKLENFQLTGSFKIRGALNKILSLGPKARQTKLITASSGNHGVAFAWCIREFALNGEIYLPRTVPANKLEHLQFMEVPFKLVGDDCVVAEEKAKEQAQKNCHIYISPYNDWEIIAGQGTIGLELTRQLSSIDAVFVPVGGGGLISGIAGFLKNCFPSVKIIGCQPENSAVMYHSLQAGSILDLPSQPTISDGTAGGIEKEALTFKICRALVDDFVLLKEEEIIAAIRLLLEQHYLLIEGAGALSVAAFLKNKAQYRNQSIILVLSGARLSPGMLRKIYTT